MIHALYRVLLENEIQKKKCLSSYSSLKVKLDRAEPLMLEALTDTSYSLFVFNSSVVNVIIFLEIDPTTMIISPVSSSMNFNSL